ncbi:MAG: hypothetical protein OXI87_04835 [Albidovulum sp.]|nr:hypothetical protein [Albidovulum sp.]
MLEQEEVTEIVSNLFHERFKNVEIISVDINEDTDADGDEILRVKVVFSADGDRLDSSLTSGFLRYLRPKLSELGIERFPVMSFISMQDSGSTAA